MILLFYMSGTKIIIISTDLFMLSCFSPADQAKMDAIRKKMQSLKAETEGLYATIRGFEEATAEATARADQVILLMIFYVKILSL